MTETLTETILREIAEENYIEPIKDGEFTLIGLAKALNIGASTASRRANEWAEQGLLIRRKALKDAHPCTAYHVPDLPKLLAYIRERRR